MNDGGDDDFEALLVYLRDTRGADFTGYKRPSLTRLVSRRMGAAGVASYREYADLLQVESGELAALLDTLLINVTAAFRDPAAWASLEQQHLPAALAALGPDEPVRVWSAACATGQEAYSLAIVLHGLLGHDEYLRRVKIYATDIDDGALAVARTGRYAARQLEGLTDAQRDVYFRPDGEDLLRFRADLRPSLIFGRHDLLHDAPISRVVLLACRNALMYFTPDTQTRVLERFAFALHEQGLLMLGKAEMLLTQSAMFTPVDLPQRLFRPRRDAVPATARLTALAVGGSTHDVELRRATELAFDSAPAAQVVLDRTGRVVLLNERAERDLRLSRGDLGVSFHALEVSRRPSELRGAVAAVQASRETVQLTDVVRTGPGGSTRWWDVCVSPLVDGAVVGVHLVFDDVTDRHELSARLDALERELSRAHEELQSSNEELETTNEELHSAVEELETTNEELQSTNEELETMNEELQSTNEELQTLNDELRERTQEVDQVNGFLQGILSGLATAIIVVDDDYRVQLWNDQAEQLTGLRSFETHGRRLTDLPVSLSEDAVKGALATAVVRGQPSGPVDVEVRDRFGTAQTRRLAATPLRRDAGGSGGMGGAVVTLSDSAPADA